jgi:hypothetical protein
MGGEIHLSLLLHEVQIFLHWNFCITIGRTLVPGYWHLRGKSLLHLYTGLVFLVRNILQGWTGKHTLGTIEMGKTHLDYWTGKHTLGLLNWEAHLMDYWTGKHTLGLLNWEAYIRTRKHTLGLLNWEAYVMGYWPGKHTLGLLNWEAYIMDYWTGKHTLGAIEMGIISWGRCCLRIVFLGKCSYPPYVQLAFLLSE